MTNCNLIRPDLRASKPYPINSGSITHRLHHNELPWSPLDLSLNRYPDRKREQVLQADLANLYQVRPEQILLTRGSTEGIDLLMRLFLQPGVDSIMQFSPTFDLYAFFARLQLAKIIDCPLIENEEFSLPVAQIEANWQPGCKLIMLCRPNNPTASSIDLSVIASLCEQFRKRSIIVVDEAYIEFSDEASATSLIDQYDNLIVLRTLSKAYGLAGLRLGTIIAEASLIERLQNTLPPYHLSSQVVEVAIKALSNPNWFKKSIEQVMDSRTMLTEALQGFPGIKVYPSSANFLLIKTVYAEKLMQLLSAQGIAVRLLFPAAKLQHYLRITIGDKAQNALLLNTIESIRGWV